MPDRQLSDAQIALLDHLYQENAKIAAAFWDWRHKLMAFTFTIVSGLAAVGTWATTRQANLYAVAGAFLVAALLSLSTALLNRRTGEIVDKTYAAGTALEVAIKEQLAGTLDDHDLMFAQMKIDKASSAVHRRRSFALASHWTKPTFEWVLTTAYIALTMIFIAAAAAVIVSGQSQN